MIYQAYNQTPNQTLFDFEKLENVTRTVLSGHRFYKKGTIGSSSYELATVNETTTGYFYEYRPGHGYSLVYLPDAYNSEYSYYNYKAESRIRYVPTLEDVSDVNSYYTADYYSTPFTFYINGNSNLYGYRIQIYKNVDNSLAYDSNIISSGEIVKQNYNNKNKSTEYKIYPNGSQQINIFPTDINGNNVKIYAYLPAGLDVLENKLENGEDATYNWVLTQYYELSEDNEINENKYVKNNPVFFIAKPTPSIGVRAYRYNESGEQVSLTSIELENYPYRNVYFQSYYLYDRDSTFNSHDFAVGNYFNYTIETAKWGITQNIYENEILISSAQVGDIEYRVSPSLDYYIDFLRSPVNAENNIVYLFSPEVGYKNKGDDAYIVLLEQYGGEVRWPEMNLTMKMQYLEGDIGSFLNFTAETCQQRQYISLKWNADYFMGRYYENNKEIVGDDLQKRFINISRAYNAGGGMVERELNSIYLPIDSKLVYSDKTSSSFVVSYNSKQILFRYCNIDNLIGDIFVIANENKSFVYKLYTVQDGEDIKIGISLKRGNTLISTSTPLDINVSSFCWQTFLIKLTKIEDVTLANLSDTVDILKYYVNEGLPFSYSNDALCTAYNIESCPTLSAVTEDIVSPNQLGESSLSNGQKYLVSKKCDIDFGESFNYPMENFFFLDGIFKESLPSEKRGSGYIAFINNGTTRIYEWEAGTGYVLAPHSVPVTNRVYHITEWDSANNEYYKRYFYYDGAELKETLPEYLYPLVERSTVTRGVIGGWGNTEGQLLTELNITNSEDNEEYELTEMTLSGGLFNYLYIGDLSNLSLETYLKEFSAIYPIKIDDELYAAGYPRRENIEDVYFLAVYNKSQLNGSSLVLENEDVKYWRIDRIDSISGTSSKVFIGEVGENGGIKDYGVPNNWVGYYSLSPIAANYTQTSVFSNLEEGKIQNNVTNWNNYSLIILNEPDDNNNQQVKTIFYWALNSSTGEMSNNTSFSVQETLSRYKRISKSQTNAISGTLQCLLGYMENGVYHNDSVEVMNKIYEIQMSNNTKILKDRNGKNYVVEFTSPITFSQDTNAGVNSIYTNGVNSKNITAQPTTMKISWIEVAQSDGIQAISYE